MAGETYQVVATALNLRDAPGPQGRVLSVLAQGQTVVAAAPEQLGWLEVFAAGVKGFASAQYLQPVVSINDGVALASATGSVSARTPAAAVGAAGSASAATAARAAGPVLAAASSVDVNVKDRDLSRLHPVFRTKVNDLLQRFQQESLPFRVFEACRAPERQEWLFAQGRTRMTGGIVTNAQAWASFHQYGLAVDFVLFENGQWTWDDKGPRRAYWARLRDLVQSVGLRSLSFEVPHAEWPTNLAELQAGRLPDGGDDSWHNHLEAAVNRWQGRHPNAPAWSSAERPPLPGSST